MIHRFTSLQHAYVLVLARLKGNICFMKISTYFNMHFVWLGFHLYVCMYVWAVVFAFMFLWLLNLLVVFNYQCVPYKQVVCQNLSKLNWVPLVPLCQMAKGRTLDHLTIVHWASNHSMGSHTIAHFLFF